MTGKPDADAADATIAAADADLQAAMAQSVADDIAAQEAAAREFQMDYSTAGVGSITPIEVFTQQYVFGDQLFAAKAKSLPAMFPRYRAVRGDGNCGWRAIGFGYFEALVYADQTGKAGLVTAERQRLARLNDYIRDVGHYEPYVYEDMVEWTDALFADIEYALPDTDRAVDAVVEAFNDDEGGAANAIIYHLRLLAASYLKEHAAEFQDYIPDYSDPAKYCQDWIELPNCEIDHLRMELLAKILLQPLDIVLEVAYLDRSSGDGVPVYLLPQANVGREEATIERRISLLFRPDHYDIVYRPSLPAKSVPSAVSGPAPAASTSTDAVSQH